MSGIIKEENMSEEKQVTASGGCLCGAVRYEIRGPLRNVINCHCSKCRRFHGHTGAYTSIRREHLVLTVQSGLKWYRSVTDETPNVHRGFCHECGSSLFWDPRGSGSNIAVAAGSLDAPTGLKTVGHVWVSQIADYYEITDGLPKFETSHGGKLQ
ncbi:MAG: GFA family protein [Deltaproteobacteria bacterium]|jgi:hypothetical protein|nr:GFA family protein [Deltaproteobacteria bacterium]